MDKETKRSILAAQKSEITEHLVYERLSNMAKGRHNRDILKKISGEELGHYNFWKEYTKQDTKADIISVWKYILISRLFGLTFAVKLMERGEGQAKEVYTEMSKSIKGAKRIAGEEYQHEKQLIGMIDEERLGYISSVVLGLNDALVELTGALAGFTLALQHTKLVALTGLITGIAAALSMSASEYLSTKSEEGTKNPLRASFYTGIAYILTVVFLIFPYLILENALVALGITLLNAILIILVFSFYVSVAKELDFKKRFSEMAAISLGVTAVTFLIGLVVSMFFDISV